MNQFPPPGGIGGQQHAAGFGLEAFGGLFRRVVEVQRLGRLASGRGGLVPGHAYRRLLFQGFGELCHVQIKFFRFEWRPFAVSGALLVSLTHLVGERRGRFLAAGQRYKPVFARQVVEQAGGALEKQRQVLLQPLSMVAIADFLVGQGAS